MLVLESNTEASTVDNQIVIDVKRFIYLFAFCLITFGLFVGGMTWVVLTNISNDPKVTAADPVVHNILTTITLPTTIVFGLCFSYIIAFYMENTFSQEVSKLPEVDKPKPPNVEALKIMAIGAPITVTIHELSYTYGHQIINFLVHLI